jgi:hypothetical protein
LAADWRASAPCGPFTPDKLNQVGLLEVEVTIQLRDVASTIERMHSALLAA